MQCTNNLKQIGIAMHNYHDIHGTFPPGNTWQRSAYDQVSNCRLRTDPATNSRFYCGMIGWAAFILPQMEQTSTYSLIDFTKRMYADHVGEKFNGAGFQEDTPDESCGVSTLTNQVTASRSAPSSLLCPSTPAGSVTKGSQKDYAVNGAMGSPERVSKEFTNTNDASYFAPSVGLFWQNSDTNIANILDGTSHTILASERSHNVRPKETLDSTCSREARNAFIAVSHGSGGYVTFTESGGTKFPPNFCHKANQCAAYSYHPGGVNATLADASVRFISDTVDFNVWAATFTIANAGYDAGLSITSRQAGGGSQTCDSL